MHPQLHWVLASLLKLGPPAPGPMHLLLQQQHFECKDTCDDLQQFARGGQSSKSCVRSKLQCNFKHVPVYTSNATRYKSDRKTLRKWSVLSDCNDGCGQESLRRQQMLE